MHEMMDGMNCSPFEAKAILEMTYKVFGSYFETNGSLKPGQMFIQVTSVNTAPNTNPRASIPTILSMSLSLYLS